MVVETIKERNHTIEIFVDEFAESPREWDNISKMVCSHRRYSLGDEELITKHSSSWKEAFASHIANEFNLCVEDYYDLTEKEYDRVWRWINSNLIWDALSLYDHSGITISLGVRNGWDSGQVGFVYIHKDDAVEAWGNEYFTKAIRKIAQKCIEEEVRVYDNYLKGNVYGYRVSKIRNFIKVFEDGSEEFGEEPVLVDSCSGYYGDHKESGLLEDAMSLID